MKRTYSKSASKDAWLRDQRRAANALVTFCEAHHCAGADYGQVVLCRNALNIGDISAAVSAYESVALGGNGCFNDWIPKGSDKNAVEYASSIFQALVERWSRLMRLSVVAHDA